uniref:Uncharacterized protein n=1 Tax=Arundo donax TaxID=35708 RepID=A0A0A9ANJ4_ARUDO
MLFILHYFKTSVIMLLSLPLSMIITFCRLNLGNPIIRYSNDGLRPWY